MVDEVTTEEVSTEEVTSLEDLSNLGNEGEATPEEPAAEPEYTPNFEYTFKDETRQFDERLRGAVTSKEVEDYIRDLYTKADGLESYKDKLKNRNYTDDQYNQVYQQTEALTQGFQRIKELRDGKKYHDLIDSLGWNREEVIDFALQLAKENELPDDQKQQVQQNREMERKLQQMESQVQGYQTQLQGQQVQDDLRQLEGLMSSPDVSPVVQALNDKNMNFAEMVVQQGMYETQLNGGKEPTLKSVVDKVAAQWQHLVPVEQPVTQEQQPVAEQKPTLPKVSGSPTNAVDKPVGSLDDLRKLAQSRIVE